MSKEEEKYWFRFHTKPGFIRELSIYHEFYTKDEWQIASRQYLKSILKNKSLEEYVEEIFIALDRLIDIDVKGETVNWILYTWGNKLTKDIKEIADKNKEKEHEFKTTKGIYEKNRKTLVPKIKRAIHAYRIIQDIVNKTSYNESGTYQASVYHSFIENQFIHNLKETSNILKEIADSKTGCHIKVNDKDFTEGYYTDFLSIELQPEKYNKELYKIGIFLFNVNNSIQAYDLNDRLKHTIINYMQDLYGKDGYVIARYLLESDSVIKNLPKNQKVNSIFNKKPKPRNRPENIELNRIIINLDDHGVDEIEIARLINTLENKEIYKLETNERDKTWSTQKRKYVSLNKQKVKKAIRQRIKTLGGNHLKYQIMNFIKERGECTLCDWKYNEVGNIIRIPCKKHLNSNSFTDVRFGSPNWQKSLQKRGLNFYANALTFVPAEIKSKITKNKKRK